MVTSWLQILTDFLSGESKSIADSFGHSKEVVYKKVKARLIKECNFRNFKNDCYSRFLKTVRKDCESLQCFNIRFEVLAGRISSDRGSGR